VTWGWIGVTALLIGGLIVRLPLTESLPMAFSPQRQFYSALTARSIYFQIAAEPIPDWRREVVNTYVRSETRTEPAFIETMAALAYRVFGGEDIRIMLGLSLVYWGIGGVFLYLLARDLAGSAFVGWIALAIYLFLPYAITSTRALMTDPPALMFMLAALWLARRGGRWGWALAAVAGGLAIWVRAQTALFLLPGCLALIPDWKGWRRFLTLRRLALAAAWLAVCAAPFAIYAAGNPSLAERAGQNFVPSLFMEESFWRAWGILIQAAFPLALLILAASGALIGWRGVGRRLAVTLWLSYAVYGALFNFHIHTHPYYQSIFVPAVALSAAGWAAWLDRRLIARLNWRLPLRAALTAGVCALLLTTPDRVRISYDPGLIDAYRAAGEAANHSMQVLALTQEWGTPLNYYGELFVRNYPSRFIIEMYSVMDNAGASVVPMTPAERVALYPFPIEYFIVTDLEELARQPDLQAYLQENGVVIAQNDLFQVYDLRMNQSGEPS
jgi:hypothetical protein